MTQNTYQLLDTGSEAKLELVGPWRLVRPCPQAVWPRRLPAADWDRADGVYVRSTSGGGSWDWHRKLPETWSLHENGLPWLIKPTGFGHLGIFPEQTDNWQWLQARARADKTPGMRALNLFAYTGGSTLALAHAGAHVTHVDAARGVVAWARDNARDQQLPGDRVQWLVEDVMKFCHREQRRGHRYQGIVLDPPTFGRGPTGELWKIESDLADLLGVCRQLLQPDAPGFVLLSCHSPGFSPLCLDNLLRATLGDPTRVETGEMSIPESGTTRRLPAGCFARWITD